MVWIYRQNQRDQNGRKKYFVPVKETQKIYKWSREKIFRLKGNACQLCENSELNILEIHHVDGDRSNNVIENLVLVCPNCHTEGHKWQLKKQLVLRLLYCLEFLKIIHVENNSKITSYGLIPNYPRGK